MIAVWKLFCTTQNQRLIMLVQFAHKMLFSPKLMGEMNLRSCSNSAWSLKLYYFCFSWWRRGVVYTLYVNKMGILKYYIGENPWRTFELKIKKNPVRVCWYIHSLNKIYTSAISLWYPLNIQSKTNVHKCYALSYDRKHL